MAQPDDGFNAPIEIDLFEEYDSAEQVAQSGLKSQPTKYAKDDGGLLHYSGRDTPYTVSVERTLAVDGWEDASKQQAMSLLVLDYSTKCTDASGRFASIWSWIDLEDAKNTPQDKKAAPRVEAWAPFASERRWGENEDDVHTEGGWKAGLGVTAKVVDAHIDVDGRKSRDKKEVFFDKGLTTKRFSDFDDRRVNGVKWFLTHNKSLEQGVPPDFRLAILFRRKNDTPFDLIFGFRCAAGRLQDIMDSFFHWFGKGKYIDKKYLYTPNEQQPRYRNRAGEELLAMVDPNNLGKLLKENDEELQKLTSVWGLGPIEPQDEQVIPKV